MNIQDLREALWHPNVVAFLRAIRLGEGTSDEAGYYRIVGGGTFTNDATHPNVKVYIKRYDVYSTAAGAYQIIRGTWNGLVKQYGFLDFSPDNQDLAAVALIVEKKALDDVKAGRLADAVRKCATIWASLPGSTAGQRTEDYAAGEKEYTDHGGTLA